MTKKKEDDQKIGNIAPYGLRMMPELREKIERAAFENGRSMNSEITSRLEYTFEVGDLGEKEATLKRSVSAYEGRSNEIIEEILEKINLSIEKRGYTSRAIGRIESDGSE